MLRAISEPPVITFPTANTGNGKGTVNGIVSATGAYNNYPAVATVVAASAIKSHIMVATAAADNSSTVLLDTVHIPSNCVGPDGWLELEVTWGCNSSANVKQLVPSYWTLNGTSFDQQTTNISSTFRVVIAGRNSIHAQMITAAAPASGVQGAANAVQAGGYFMDTAFTSGDGIGSAENNISLFGVTTSATSGDSIWIERWSLTAYNPPVYSTKRLNYGKVQFYGANSHYDDSQSISQHIADMKTLGVKTLRITYEFGSSLPTLVSYAQAIQTDNTGIQMCVNLDMSITSDGTNPWASEAAAYTYAYNTAVTVCTALAPYGVQIYECGNEMDTKNGINTGDPLGGYASTFSNTLVPIFRGVQRGAIDGIHATGALLGKKLYSASNAYTQCSIGLADMMWYGVQPDGTTGHPTVRWDLTNWHNYEDYGPLVGVPRSTSQGWVNLLDHFNRNYGVPIIITEWNGKASDTDPQRAFWASRWLAEAYNNRYKYNIAFVCVYEMYGTPWNVMTGTLGTVESTFGTTVQTFITNNPDTGL
jgi:hypothetical protein